MGCKRELLRILTQHCREREREKLVVPLQLWKEQLVLRLARHPFWKIAKDPKTLWNIGPTRVYFSTCPPAFNSTLIYGLFYDTFCQFVIHLGHITFWTCNKFHKNVPLEGQIECTRLIFDFLPWIFKCFPLQLGYFLQTVPQKQENSHNHGVIICPWIKPQNAIFTRKTRKCLTYQSPT